MLKLFLAATQSIKELERVPEHSLKHLLNEAHLNIKLEDAIIFGIKLVVIYLVVRILTALAKYIFRHTMRKQAEKGMDVTKVMFLKQIVVTAIYIIGCATFLSLIPGMEKISNSILASAGILAMAVGLASQEALSNIVGGLFIIFTRPFKVGDFIKVDSDVVGTVIEITLRHTIIKNIENRMILIPNSKINSATIINSSYGDSATCAFIDIGVSYDTNLDRAIQVMRSVIMLHPMLIDHRTKEEKEKNEPEVAIRVVELGDSAITLRAWAWADTAIKATIMKYDLLKSIKERFDVENIEIPYPYFNQIVKKE
ncbi:MAG TPA: mechanosensitive ion channel protein MscS [Prevotella sp.]|nr:mechanosensitive ion channel protein MscS [Prevotella sp.]